jgi:hypothetical protein
VGEHRSNLARRSIKEYLEHENLPYHSPHKFRHGHIQYGLAHAKTIADFKAVSMNVMHTSMKITDEFYSNLNDGDIKKRISGLTKKVSPEEDDDLRLINEFIQWKKRNEETIKNCN